MNSCRLMYAPYVQLAVDRSALPDRLSGLGASAGSSHKLAVWPAGAVFLMSGSSGLPIPEVLRFLRAHFISRLDGRARKSLNTISAYVYDLCDYYDYLDSRGLQALSVKPSHVENYVHSMSLNNSPVTKRKFSVRTIARRMSTIRQFYTWAGKHGLTQHQIPVDPRSRNDPDGLWFVEKDRLYNPRTPRIDLKVTTIPVDKLRMILKAAGPLVADPSLPNQVSSPRLRLMFECGLQAGLRRFEISLLRLKSIEAAIAKARSNELLSKCPVRVYGKGGKTRTVLFPLWLALDLRNYAASIRKISIETRMKKSPSFKDHGYLFVHDALGRACVGDAFDDFYLSGPMRSIQIKLGIRAGVSEETGFYERLYGVHALRHTYAVHAYISARRAGDPEPWKFVQTQLGHSSDETTKQIYLPFAIEYEHQFGELLKKEINAARLSHG